MRYRACIVLGSVFKGETLASPPATVTAGSGDRDMGEKGSKDKGKKEDKKKPKYTAKEKRKMMQEKKNKK